MGKEWTAKNNEANKIENNSNGGAPNSGNSVGGVAGKFQKNAERPIVLRKRRERVKSVGNWQLFYYMFTQDHQKPNLIWNYKVRILLSFNFY
jgi:hypothetical protein